MNDPDDLFGLPPPAPAAAPATKAAAKADGAPDSRREVRVLVKWAARVLLPNGQVVPMRVRDISESGIGLVGEHSIPPHTTLRVALSVPDVNTPGRFTTVTGSFRTAHVTVSGPDLLYGGTWLEIGEGGRELVHRWLRKLRP